MKNKNSIFTVIAILGFAYTTMAQLPYYVPTNGLVAAYFFNGNANDLSGNGSNGTVSNATLTTDRNGNANSAYSFNGTSSNISLGIDTAVNSIFNNFSISYWINKIDSNQGLVIGSGSTQAGGSHRFLSRVIKNVQVSFISGTIWYDAITSNNSIQLNQWQNVIYVRNGATATIYINGVSILTTSVSGNSMPNPTSPYATTKIGSGFNNAEYFNGKIDDIGIWNRALTSQEIYNIYHACSDSISTQPTDQYGFKGTNKTFSFVHSGTNVNYQWQTNPLNFGWLNLSNSGQYSNTTTNSFTISGISVFNHNQSFRVVSSITGCNNDTSNVVHLNISDIVFDSLRAARLQNDSSRLTNDSINYLARISKLSNDSSRLTSDSINYLARVLKLSNDSSRLTNDSIIYLASVSRLRNDSARLTNDSIFYLTRISKLSNDSSRLTNDSINYLASISFLKSDTTSKGISLTFLKTDTTNKGLSIVFLQNDTTNKGTLIRQLQTNLANKHDTVYIASIVTSDTLKISIHTGISQISPTINSLKVYPNPASTILHIDLSSPGYFTAKISGITGQSIITPTSGTIDVSSLANGIYILTIYDSSGKLISTNKVSIAK